MERPYLGVPGLAGCFQLAVSTGNAEAVASNHEGLLRLCVLKAKARADICVIDPPIHLAVLCNAGGFSAQKFKLSSYGSDN